MSSGSCSIPHKSQVLRCLESSGCSEQCYFTVRVCLSTEDSDLDLMRALGPARGILTYMRDGFVAAVQGMARAGRLD